MEPVTIKTSYNLTGRSVTIPPGYRMPQSYTVEVDDPQRGVSLTIKVVVENGQPVCDELRVKRTTTQSIAGDERYPLKTYLRGTFASVATRVRDRKTGRPALLRPRDVDMFYRTLTGGSAGPRPTIERRRVDMERLKQVATIYRAAVENGEPPARRIATELGGAQPFKLPYARRLVMMARREGLLGPAKRGQAGEEN